MIILSKIKQLFLQYGKNLSLYFLASLIPMLLNLVSNPFIAMNMAPRDYAIVGYFTSFNSLIEPLISFYMVQYYIRNYFTIESENRYKLKALVFKSLISFSLLLAIFSYLGIWFYIARFNPNVDFPIFPYLLMTVLPLPMVGLYQLQSADYRMEKKANKFFIIAVTYGILNIIMNLVFVVFLKLGASGRLAAPIIVNIFFFSWLFYKNKNLFTVKTTLSEFVALLKFCWPLALGAMLGYFSHGFEKTSLETLHDTTTYGIYIVGAQMAGYLTVFANSIGATFQPDVYEAIIKGWHKRLARLYAMQLGMILGIVFLYVLLAPYVILILTAGRYVDATPFTRVIAFATLANAIYYNINGFTIGKGYPKLYTITTALGGLVIIVLMPVMIKKFAFFGAAYMTSISYLVLSAINIFLLWIVFSKKKRNNKNESKQ